MGIKRCFVAAIALLTLFVEQPRIASAQEQSDETELEQALNDLNGAVQGGYVHVVRTPGPHGGYCYDAYDFWWNWVTFWGDCWSI